MDRLKDWVTPNSYKYSALPSTSDGRQRPEKRPRAWTREERHRLILKLVTCGLVFALVLYIVASYVRSSSNNSCDTAKEGFTCKAEVSHYWGQYSPYYEVPSSISRSTPKGCEVNFAQILSRHGARDPTAGKTIVYGALIARIHQTVKDYGKHFKFIKHYNYKLGADQLSDFGRQEMVNSGIKFYKRYEHLTRKESPFVRTAGQHRVVESAELWTKGFHESREADGSSNLPDPYPYGILVIPEGPQYNNTLSHEVCTAANQRENYIIGVTAQRTWYESFTPPIRDRLNKNLPGANLTNKEVIYMMDLCPYETVANVNGKLSMFCHLFSKDEWHSYDYYQSLGKWYGWSSGNPFGPTQGVGYVNELIARLTSQPVVDHTDTNSTLDSDPETFPLDKVLYADFSHDNDMSSIFAALGLYNETEPLSNTTKVPPKSTHGYSASWSVPFASRMYVEKMSCQGYDEDLVRVLVNDRVIPLQNCDADKLGRCTLSKWVDSLSFARNGGYWDRCFAPSAATDL